MAADPPAKAQAGGLRRIASAWDYTRAGLKSAWRREAAFRQEVVLAALLLPFALYLPDTAVGRALLIASLGLVLIVELLNSAVETVVDLVSPQHHRLAGIAKDIASAAVFVSLLTAAVVWVTVLL